MINQTIKSLGVIYGIAKEQLPEIIDSARVVAASNNPLAGLNEAMRILTENNKLQEVESRISALLNECDVADFEKMESGFPEEYKGLWWIGFYQATKEDSQKKGLAAMLEAKHMTQTQLAKAIGVTQKDVSRWKTGAVKPNTETLAKIAAALGCMVDDLI